MKRSGTSAALMLTAACTSIQTTPHPSGVPNHFQRMLVMVNTGDTALRTITESSFVAAGLAIGVEFVTRDEVVPPGRWYTDIEVMDFMERQEIPAVIVISDARAWTLPPYRMPFEVPGQRAVPSEATMDGERFEVETRVFDVGAGEFVWTADTQVRRGGANDKRILRKVAEDIVTQLLIDGVIRGRRTPSPGS